MTIFMFRETMHAVIRTISVLLVALLSIGAAHADSWPARPIRLIVTQGAGGTPDLIARMLGVRLTRALGQQIVVENRPGGGNTIGAQVAARAAPDGYTFLFATSAALVTNPPQSTRAFVRAQYDLWGKVARDIGLKPE
jgi:tripartite-type tricarboxylate transporter receptor subunit TctC